MTKGCHLIFWRTKRTRLKKHFKKSNSSWHVNFSAQKLPCRIFPGIWNVRIALIENSLKMLQKCQIYLIFISISVHKVTVWKFPGIWNARIAPYVWSGKLLSGANVIYSGHVGMWTLYRPENMLRTVQVKPVYL